MLQLTDLAIKNWNKKTYIDFIDYLKSLQDLKY